MDNLVLNFHHLVFRDLFFDVFCAISDQILLNMPHAQHVVRVRKSGFERMDEGLFSVGDDYSRKGNIIQVEDVEKTIQRPFVVRLSFLG